jgi:hypothetical protein
MNRIACEYFALRPQRETAGIAGLRESFPTMVTIKRRRKMPMSKGLDDYPQAGDGKEKQSLPAALPAVCKQAEPFG